MDEFPWTIAAANSAPAIDVRGLSKADARRHVLTRVALLRQLEQDPRVQNLFGRWADALPCAKESVAHAARLNDAQQFLVQIGLQSFPWIAQELRQRFYESVLRQRGHTDDTVRVWFVPKELTAGRNRTSDHLRRNVRWFYLATIAEPRIGRRRLAREYAAERASVGEYIEAESATVDRAIDDVRRLLALGHGMSREALARSPLETR